MSELTARVSGFPVVVEIPVAWGEMDAMGHVNNIVYFRYFETARMRYLELIGYLEEKERSGLGPILASTQCRFRRPLTFPDTVAVGARVDELGEDRFVMRYQVVSHRLAEVAAEGDGVIVSFDYRSSRKVSLPGTIRQAIEELEASK